MREKFAEVVVCLIGKHQKSKTAPNFSDILEECLGQSKVAYVHGKIYRVLPYQQFEDFIIRKTL